MGSGTRARTDPQREIVQAAGACQSLGQWFAVVLDGVDNRLGFARCSLLLVLRATGRSQHPAFAGASRGMDDAVLRDYFERWASSDPLAGMQAHRMFDEQGTASTSELYRDLDHAQRRFVDEFLASNGIADQLSLRLAGNGVTDAYLTVHAPKRISPPKRAGLEKLRPGLDRQLRARLPRGLPGPLSQRERQAAELVSFGFTNREIATAMNVGEDTPKKHLFRAMRKLGIERRTQLAVAWMIGHQVI